ncbi:MAG: DNA polymerase III subunit alpha [Actinobacteria bacterium]|nr:DNA polymerase III subunit alpha [Actinomycetota bacterium]
MLRVHLHTHSEFSLLDGASRIKDMVNRAKELKMDAIALTDHGVMYGVVDFYETASKAGVKPIVGCEVYVAPESRFDKSSRKGSAGPYHLVLLAENSQGYRNLMHLVSLGFLDGFYYKPRVDKELLREYHNGLIALSGCLAGEVSTLIQNKDFKKAKETALEYQNIFGEGNFFLEVQDHRIEEQKLVNEHLIKISAETDIPLAATNDAHYTNKEDHTAHDVLLCIQTGSTVEEQNRLKFSTNEFYLKSFEEMAKIFPNNPEALENTVKIANRCNLEIDFDKIYLPEYEVPKGYTLDSYLEELCRKGLKEKYSEVTSELEERLEHELNVIKEMGFSGYFLIVWDFVNYAKENGIRVGPGRGSAAGSIVSYALNITTIDPIKYGLLFERFLNPERKSMPDIDIDFDDEKRDKIIEYVADKYGQDKVAQIITFGTMKARAATRDAGRVLGFPYARVDKIAKLILETPGATIEESLTAVPQLRQEYENDADTRRILDSAKTLEGLARQDSIHAAGVVISRGKMTDYAPVQKKGDSETVIQYHMDATKKIGLLKMDFLGLRTLTVINNALQIIGQSKGIDINIDEIPLNDQKTFYMLQRGDSTGVFQLESSGMRNLLRDLRPSAFEDIVHLLALYRPGPLGSNMVKDFVDCKHGRKAISYPHPSLEEVLKGTHGIIVYQEQVMQIASVMAGFTMAEADILRGAMSKKKPEVLAEQREKFIGGALSNGIDADTAGRVFDLVVHFAGYGFNKSHSTAYAVISYQTAYLKANYPVEFMAALLTSVMGNKDKVSQYVNECRRLGIEVLPPDVNESFQSFTVVGSAIRFGLSAIRNIGDAAIESIIKARSERQFKDIYDFCERVDLSAINKRALESLIKCGSFDSTLMSRKYLLSIYDKAVDAGQRKQKDVKAGQFTFFDLAPAEENSFYTQKETGEESKEEFPKDKLLAYEKEILGLYVSDHPLLGLESAIKKQVDVSISDLREQRDGSFLWIGGLIAGITKTTTKKGDMMQFLRVEDIESSVEVIVFPAVCEKYRDLLFEDNIVRIRGRLDVKEDSAKLIAQEVEILDKTKVGPSSLCLKVNVKNTNNNLMKELKEILKRHPGASPVFLELEEEERMTKMKLNDSFKVNSSNGLFAELKELLGEEAVCLQ